MPADLHIHSKLSDGTEMPEEIVKLAKSGGLKTIALTDHDNMDGVKDAAAAGKQLGVEVIPGIEFTCEVPGAEVHILGYFIDAEQPALLEELERIQEGRVQRIHKISEKLKALGIDLRPEEVFKFSGRKAPGRPHVARALIAKGVVGSFKEAFDRFLEYKGPAYVSHYKLAPREAIKLILAAGGLPAMAHPAVSGRDEIIEKLTGEGLQGLEAYYPTHSPQQVEHYVNLARKLGLIPTGGSDYHGKNSGRDIRLGDFSIPDELAEKLKDEHLRRNRS
ncbi:PHP domain-containing protein [Candidatus Saganbacteria bacterium]|nr:PHP domain-containing protein [Candidatus Saganbacteria bacterium]